jgi:hypothetical protein
VDEAGCEVPKSCANRRQSLHALYMSFERPIKDPGPNREKVDQTIAVQIRSLPLGCAEEMHGWC